MFKEQNIFLINKKKFRSFHRTLIIGEIGSNHNHNLKKTFELINEAKKAGCDAVKFQKRTVEKVYSKKLLDSPRSTPCPSDLKVGAFLIVGQRTQKSEDFTRTTAIGRFSMDNGLSVNLDGRNWSQLVKGTIVEGTKRLEIDWEPVPNTLRAVESAWMWWASPPPRRWPI